MLTMARTETHGSSFSPWQAAAPPIENVPVGHGMISDVFSGHMDPAGQRYMLLLAQNDPAGQMVQTSRELKNMPGAQPA
jgi:hypothetical protein